MERIATIRVTSTDAAVTELRQLVKDHWPSTLWFQAIDENTGFFAIRTGDVREAERLLTAPGRHYTKIDVYGRPRHRTCL